MKAIKPAAINALIEALTHIYWRKNHLQRFLLNTVSSNNIKARINAIDWSLRENTKRVISTNLVELLASDQTKYFNELLALIENVLEFESFPHLENEEDAEDKIKKAISAVQALKGLSEGYFDAIQKQREIEKLREQSRSERRKSINFQNQLTELNERFNSLVCSTKKQTKGYALELLMYDLFKLFALDSSPSFKRDYDQIDGAFTLNGTEYLFEAKWTTKPTNTSDIDIFNSKIEGSTLENTLGVFLSINGFTNNAKLKYANRRASVIMIEGLDLMSVLKGDTGFDVLIETKKKHAARFGKQ